MTNATPAQFRAARGLLNVSAAEIGTLAAVGSSSMHRLEHGLPTVRAIASIVARALEDMGVEFIPGGVRLRAIGPAGRVSEVSPSARPLHPPLDP